MENRCLCCGAVIPEGRQICPACEDGCPPEVIGKEEKIQKDIDDFLAAWNAFCDAVQDLFGDLFEMLRGIVFYTKEKPPKTPYFFKSKVRIHDKRPHKQHRIRNNCRKER